MTPSIDDIRDETRRRLATLHGGHVGSDVAQKAVNSIIRHIDDPTPTTLAVLRDHLAILAAGAALQATPADDYRNDRHWPAAKAGRFGIAGGREVKFRGATFVVDRGHLALAVALASAAMASGVQANNMRWHGGETDFEITDTRGLPLAMDAPTVIAFGLAALT